LLPTTSRSDRNRLRVGTTADKPPRSIAKIIVIALIVIVVGFKGIKLVLGWIEPPGCQSDAATNGLALTLHDSFAPSIAVNDGTTLSSGLLSRERQCVADVAPVKTGLDAEHMDWHRVLYQVKRTDNPDLADVTAQVGDAVPLAPERPFFTWLIQYLLN
jgi:hypothetical protein